MIHYFSVFIKGDISFQIDGHFLEYTNRDISTFGVTGLPWLPLDDIQHFGRSVFVEIRIHQPTPQIFTAPAQLLREYSFRPKKMTIRFHFDPEQLEKLDVLIKNHGFKPSEYVRKLPRIPSSTLIETFPSKALVQYEKPNTEGETQKSSFIAEIENLSPHGILLSTENQSTFPLTPGQLLTISLDPRGWFPAQISAQGVIRRITDDFNIETKNPVRHFGIQFNQLNPIDKKNLNELLKDILQRIKKRIHSTSENS